jgi:3'-5' exoribonuclease 1
MAVIMVDLEATCWEDRPHDAQMEIIEIGAVKFDLATGKIVSTFEALVRPKLNPELSAFCTQLTGIDTGMVRASEYFDQVYPKFVMWAGSRHNNVLASWGDYDKKQLRQDIDLHKLEWKLPERHINASHLYREVKGGKKRGLGTAVTECGLIFEGPAHRALADALMASKVFAALFGKELA